ncbi:unnamed protein product [Chilo suppressalis]|uniref:Uncharacterized protein n=1 Tax=Chilo suppressalis TaxID=168631 RepID=A0ABN8B4W0_CHISP|nr:unnamed protein product [Chilo suppressalis]
MNDLQSNHIRIRDDNLYGINVEQFIKSIEAKYKIDFRSLPQWKDLVKRLHVSTSDCKRKIQDANLRKLLIINKLYTQLMRNSPFELTERLARTHKKWQVISGHKRSKSKLQSDLELQDSLKYEEALNEITETSLTMHPNTEVMEAEVGSNEVPFISTVESETKITDPLFYLPANICINHHKYLSPLNSRDLSLKANIISLKGKSSPEINSKSCMTINNASLKSSPKEILIVKKTLSEQTTKFSIINCTTEYLFIRFLDVMDKSPFKKIKIIPSTQQKIYPGIALTFRLIYQLDNYEEITSGIFFKFGKNVLDVEVFKIPIMSKFQLDRQILVTESIYFSPVYMWQIRQDTGFPSVQVHVSVTDDYSYHLHIRKWAIDITHEFQDSSASMEVISVDTESFAERIEDEDFVAHSKTLVPQTEEFMEEVITSINIIQLIIEDIIDLALDIFLFNHTYMYLKPKSEKKISLYFTKPVCIGSHHCYYNFNFYDTITNEIISTRQVKVFAEVLPHPIQIYPAILDMSLSPVAHGFYEDNILITNSHKSYPVTIKIQLTTKMKQLFRVCPMKTFIPALSSAKLAIKLCSNETYYCNAIEDMAYFIFKIIIIGDKAVYKNVPPFFYELIAPCASIFKKVYNEKYFSDTQEPKFDKTFS